MKIHLHEVSTLPPEKTDKEKALQKSEHFLKDLSDIQNKLYAQKKYAVLIILQGMDASGKDGAIKSVFSGVNPAGCNVKPFVVPTEEEARHHFLWRISKECPPKGMIMIFNRSQYEEILERRVNESADDRFVKEKCEEINAFEKGLVRDGTILFKFYLHVSHAEQVARLKERQTDAQKRWKYQKKDVRAIRKHKEYKKVYEEIFKRCSTEGPWHIVPSDKNWYRNYYILRTLTQELKKYDIDYPRIDPKAKRMR